ncbi:MAG: YihY/virulence factor BrkB family protein [Chlamydiales bacterium]
MFEKIQYYFRDTLWNFPLSQERGWRRVVLRWLRIVYLAGRGFYLDKCSLSASSLTYYTMMSIVPVLAMAFAVARGFGYHETLRAELLERFPDQNEALIELFSYAETVLEQAKGGVVAGFGLVILFLTVVLLLSNLESILNHVWGVKNLRSWRRIFSDYFALMLIAPIFFVLASSMAVFAVENLEIGIRILPVSGWAISWLLFLVHIIPYCLFWILFTFIYLFMPNTQVDFRSAALAGLFAGCLYLAVQWGYIYFQVGVNRYGAIYGSMAALPLFLVWVQVSWFILLFGAELNCAHQTLNEHEFEAQVGRLSHNFKRLISLWIVHLAIKKGEFSLDFLTSAYHIPLALSKPILQELIECELLYETKESYIPSAKTSEMRIADCLEALDRRGENQFPYIDSKAIGAFEKALDHFRKAIESTPANIRLSHVPHSI